jgi:5-methylcytosine-specific restriction endonuclease McrA
MEPLKVKRKTRNLGVNTAATQEESYKLIEEICATAKCTDGKHEGERVLAVRKFYLNKKGKGLQGACITCQKNRRKNRILKSRKMHGGLSHEQIDEGYIKKYGPTKECSKCKCEKPPSEFPISISMECGLHNHCTNCSIGNSQGNGGLRDFIFKPDKDGKRYKKEAACQKCGGTEKLAVDHICPIAKGGTDCIDNKQTLCTSCNSKKTDTIDRVLSNSLLCQRYRDESLDFTDTTSLNQTLTRKVYEFRKQNIDDATLEQIKDSVAEYKTKYNLGHNLERIVNKIATLFKKS